MAAESEAPPDLAAIKAVRETLGDLVVETPVHRWRAPALSDALGPESAVFLKLELFQRTGTFKARGALLNALALDEAARERGVTAVSAGNHAIAVAFAAQGVGTSAKVVMMEGADPFRVAQVRRYGAELVLVPDVHAAFEAVRAIEADEGRTFIHPFEGRTVALGTATVGLELARQVPALDAVDRPHRRRRALRRRLLRHQDPAAGLPRLWRRAQGCGYHAPQLSRPARPRPSTR